MSTSKKAHVYAYVTVTHSTCSNSRSIPVWEMCPTTSIEFSKILSLNFNLRQNSQPIILCRFLTEVKT